MPENLTTILPKAAPALSKRATSAAQLLTPRQEEVAKMPMFEQKLTAAAPAFLHRSDEQDDPAEPESKKRTPT